MSDKTKSIIKIIIVIVTIILFIVGEILFIKQVKELTKKEILSTITQEVITDTITVTDTIIELKTKVLYRTKVDTLVTIQYDSIIQLIPIEIPIDYKLYIDTITTDSGIFNVDVLYSGYKSTINRLDVSYKSTVAPREVYKNGLGSFIGIGLGIGYGVDLKTLQLSPNFSVVITYGIGYTFKNYKNK